MRLFHFTSWVCTMAQLRVFVKSATAVYLLMVAFILAEEEPAIDPIEALVVEESEPDSDDEMHPVVETFATKTRSLFNMEHLVEYWNDVGQNIVNKHFNESKQNNHIAKNIILFVGDGMSMTTITAARIYNGGEQNQLSFEKFPYSGLTKNYCVNSQVADSACSATAFLCGVKNNQHTIGVTGAVRRWNCAASLAPENRLDSIAQWAQENNKSTGIVTNTRITHATPAAAYARTAYRSWENDADVVEDNADPEQCIDIARQLIETEPGKNFQVILGGGRGYFRSKDIVDEGTRSDGRDLIQEWVADHMKRGRTQLVFNRDDLLATRSEDTDYLLGLFNENHLGFGIDNFKAGDTTEPTLEEMTTKAIEILSKNNNGYFLLIEGGLIDIAHHKTKAQKALDETIEFSKAIALADAMTDEKDTLIVVLSDHSHTMTLSGYASRGGDILGSAGKAVDNLEILTLSYANGPGYKVHIKPGGGRVDPMTIDMHDADARFPTTVPIKYATHQGEDVPVFARGPYAHLFSGVYEQNAIAHLMAFAACIGKGAKACDAKYCHNLHI